MPWNWLKSWWRRKERMTGDIVMYTRQGCHLCEDAWELLEQARREYGFALRQVDIDEDPQLVRAYGECVPVVAVNGRVRFRGTVNRVLLRRLLESGEAMSS
jgi:glutaredoxin